MFEVLGWLLLTGGASYLGFCLGVRRERGRQMRLEEISQEKKKIPEGTRLRVIKLRR